MAPSLSSKLTGDFNLMACTEEVPGFFLSQGTDVLRIFVISLVPTGKVERAL